MSTAGHHAGNQHCDDGPPEGMSTSTFAPIQRAQTTARFDACPRDLHLFVFGHLAIRGGEQLVTIMQVCRQWRRLVGENADLWKSAMKSKWRKTPLPCGSLDPEGNWISMYRACHEAEQNMREGLHRSQKLFEGSVPLTLCFDHQLVSGHRDGTIRVASFLRDHEYGEQAQAPLVHEIRGHEQWVKAIDLNPTTIVSGSYDGKIKVWDREAISHMGPDVSADACLHVLEGHGDNGVRLGAEPLGAVYCLQLYQQDRILSGSTDGTVRLWDARRGCHLRTLAEHLSKVTCLRADRGKAVSGTNRKQHQGMADLHVWDIETGAQLGTLEGHSRRANCVDIDGNLVTSSAADSSLKLWDLRTGKCVNTIRTNGRPVRRFQADGRKIIGCTDAGQEPGYVCVWDLRSPSSRRLSGRSSPSSLVSSSSEACHELSRTRCDQDAGSVTCLRFDATKLVFSFWSRDVGGHLRGRVTLWDYRKDMVA